MRCVANRPARAGVFEFSGRVPLCLIFAGPAMSQTQHRRRGRRPRCAPDLGVVQSDSSDGGPAGQLVSDPVFPAHGAGARAAIGASASAVRTSDNISFAVWVSASIVCNRRLAIAALASSY